MFESSIVLPKYIQCHLARVGKIICSWWALLKPQACPAPPNKTNCQINLPLKPLLGLLPRSWNILHKREWKCKVSWELKVANVIWTVPERSKSSDLRIMEIAIHIFEEAQRSGMRGGNALHQSTEFRSEKKKHKKQLVQQNPWWKTTLTRDHPSFWDHLF